VRRERRPLACIDPEELDESVSGIILWRLFDVSSLCALLAFLASHSLLPAHIAGGQVRTQQLLHCGTEKYKNLLLCCCFNSIKSSLSCMLGKMAFYDKLEDTAGCASRVRIRSLARDFISCPTNIQ
jgi:hypothetical protein